MKILKDNVAQKKRGSETYASTVNARFKLKSGFESKVVLSYRTKKYLLCWRPAPVRIRFIPIYSLAIDSWSLTIYYWTLAISSVISVRQPSSGQMVNQAQDIGTRSLNLV